MICPNCKTEIPGAESQSQTIEILESQVRQLTQKLAFAVDKAADLEDDLRAIKTSSPAPSSSSQSGIFAPPKSSPSPDPTQSRFTEFLNSRRGMFTRSSLSKPVAAVKGTSPVRASTPTSNLSLEDQLQMERSAREQAEEKVVSMSTELEELSQSLFEEANAMVKAEREKCARLEARLQLMESREEDKRKRLTELEKAIARITRVRSVLENKNVANVTNGGL